MILAILYWLVLILSVIGVFVPATWPNGARINSSAGLVLFIFLGIRVFPIALS